MVCDLHTHTKHSPRGANSAYEMCCHAAKSGLSVIGITDHCECNRFYPQSFYTTRPNPDESYNNEQLFQLSVSDAEAAKEKCEGEIKVLVGTELGQPCMDKQAAEKITSDSRLDYVIGSVHQIPCCDDFCFLEYDENLLDIQLERYFCECLRMCREIDINVLGHLTYPLRYIEGKYKIKTDMKRYYDIIAEIMDTIVNRGIALEINCSGLRQDYGKTFPTEDIISLYKSHGGEFVSIGSDTHTAEFIGCGFETAKELALSCGITNGVYFEQRKPIYFKL
ncbi:MAG: histidinol-phosphatase HisJ family protein [Oscillospiraceae bacterium]